jgi:hypothetical protein
MWFRVRYDGRRLFLVPRSLRCSVETRGAAATFRCSIPAPKERGCCGFVATMRVDSTVPRTREYWRHFLQIAVTATGAVSQGVL